MLSVGTGRPNGGGEDVAAQMRTRSKLVFGNMDRLDVAVAIARTDEAVNATDLGKALDMAPNRVRTQLLALAEAGLLRSAPSGLTQHRSFLREPSVFWDFCVALAAEWEAA